jgi:thiol-disulfide isomerase/thioredoxin
MINIQNLFRSCFKILRKSISEIILIITVNCILLPFVNTANADVAQLQNGLEQSYPAHELQGITGWLNSPPLSLKSLRGKVVLLDFWNYNCPYCVESLPYLNNWYNKYRAQGLVIIGVHNPEYPYEANVNNIQYAVNRYGIQYPVALDSNSESLRLYTHYTKVFGILSNRNNLKVFRHQCL